MLVIEESDGKEIGGVKKWTKVQWRSRFTTSRAFYPSSTSCCHLLGKCSGEDLKTKLLLKDGDPATQTLKTNNGTKTSTNVTTTDITTTTIDEDMNVNIGLNGSHCCNVLSGWRFGESLVSLLLQCGIRDSHCISYCEHGALRCFHSVHDSSNHPSEVFSWKIGSRAFSQDFCPITALIETHCFWKERLGFGRICSGMMRIGGGCIKPTGILTPHLLVTTHYPCSICNVMPFIFTFTKLDFNILRLTAFM